MAVTAYAGVTLAFFFLSTVFVISPFSRYVPFPVIGRRKVTIGLMSAPILAIAILWAAQCLGATQIRNGIVGTDNIKPYNILILFISLAYMAITLDCTGILQAAAFWVSNKGGTSGRKLYFYFYLLLTGISMVVGNDPVILSGTVFLVYYTAATGLDPDAWLISEFAAANTASMVLFVGNPTNVVICEGFRINNAAFTAYTILPFLACSIACYLVLMLQYRNEKHVPRKLNVSGTLNPREVLRDPISAIFGSIWLAVCLIVVIVLSFFHVDVWKIVLPFAGGKFVFDLSWDHYRYTTGRIPTFDESKADDVETPDDPMATAFKRAMSNDMQRSGTAKTFAETMQHHTDDDPLSDSQRTILGSTLQRTTSPGSETLTAVPQPEEKAKELFPKLRRRISLKHRKLSAHFPTFFTALPRLPFGLIPFAFSQFILIEALEHQGWIDIFARWLIIMSGKNVMPVVWLVGVFGVILCNVAGTNIGATILLTKIVRASDFPESTARAAAVSLAVASNIGAVSFTFSASLAGLLWVAILKDKGITIKQWKFAMWNSLPLIAMTGVGLGVVSAMMAVLY
ncbi:hypothetical protein DFP72DRAFT_906915 [Ephemerocybe angulata]|uniref:Citrate transporter-like domain-containing protein n=1 Tax=Ephemerocybe angulata TaxID=980116 RepID=A0A8H6HTX2_9AGAR|nr:hypothetical protein DFP72DRAFT_906915 [Tulosesus angulatus]